ncbi:hypothetical protein [Streptomyces sp. NPDC004728]|uniref:hypothetical protein n=1 Tax=Streptomyces sp. NPDC004728 TaxID=3154289 RepID=UPI0033A5CC12
MPLDAYTLSPEAQERSDRAQAALEQDCLHRFGLRWPGPDERALLAGKRLSASRLATRFGLTNADQAERYGYHAPPWSLYNTEFQRAMASTDRVHAAGDVEKVLHGLVRDWEGSAVPEGGCRGEAFRTLAPGVKQVNRDLTRMLAAQAAKEAAGNPQVIAKSRQWASCMSRAGHRYASPTAAARDPQWARSREPGGRETAVAEADVRCKEVTGYLATLLETTVQRQRLLIDQRSHELGLLKQYQAEHAANVGNALAVRTARSGSPRQGKG